MSRKPVDQITSSPKPQGQDGVWAEIRKQKNFTVTTIKEATDINHKIISDCVHRLVAGGYLSEDQAGDSPAVYTLLRDAGIHMPRVRKDGTPVTQGVGNANMWRSMRVLKVFTSRDLAVSASTDVFGVSEATAKRYCSILLKAKYLRVVQKAIAGKRPATYRYIRNTGPKPPQIQRVKQVFDPNLNEVTYRSEGGL